MAKRTFASVQIRDSVTGEWKNESREMNTDDMLMYAQLHDLLFGLQYQVVNKFLSQQTTEDRRVVLDQVSGRARDLYRSVPAQVDSVVGETLQEDLCIPPLQECRDGSCRLTCSGPPTDDK